MVERMLDGIECRLDCDYLSSREQWNEFAARIVYTGAIDSFFNYSLGKLEYRTLRFETEVLDCDNYQGVAGMNFTDSDTPYTRIVEHKHFEFGQGVTGKTVITREYSKEWEEGDEPYYPVNNEANQMLYEKYRKLAEQEKNIIFGGRLAEYRYYDMDQVIKNALDVSATEMKRGGNQ